LLTVSRPAQFVLKLLTGLSALLFVATVVLWVRSYHAGESLFHVNQNGWMDEDHFSADLAGAVSVRGQIGWCATSVQADRPAKLWGLSDAIERDPRFSIGWHHDIAASQLPDDPKPTLSNAFGFHFRHMHEEQQMNFMVKSDHRDPRLPWVISDSRYVLVPHWFLCCSARRSRSGRRSASFAGSKPSRATAAGAVMTCGQRRSDVRSVVRFRRERRLETDRQICS
jgi:hypothetical protein